MLSTLSRIFLLIVISLFAPAKSLVNPCRRYDSNEDFSIIYRDCVARLQTNDLYIHTSDSFEGDLFCCRIHPLKNRFYRENKGK